MNIRIAAVSLWAEDVPASTHFYRDVVGLKIMPQHAGASPHFDLDGCVLMILCGCPALPLNPEPRFPMVAFSVPNLESAIEKLRLHGVDLPWGVEANDACRWVMFHDPAGNLVELVKFKT